LLHDQGIFRLRLSANVDPLDKRWYETEKSRVDKKRKFALYKQLSGPGEYEKAPRSKEEAYWQDIVKRVVNRLQR
jgi:hypothetical protein